MRRIILAPLALPLFLLGTAVLAYQSGRPGRLLEPQRAAAATSTDDGACVQTGLPNLLQNPSFEQPYGIYTPPNGHEQCPAGVCTSVRTAEAWSPWWRIQTEQDKGYEFKMPEFTAAEESKRWYGPPRARSGDAAQQYFTLFATHEAGVYQQVPVEPGATYCFSVWGHAWTAQDDIIPEQNHDSCPSPQGVGDACSGPEDGQLRQKIGIDPTGGTDWKSSAIVWSDQVEHVHGRLQYDSFDLFVITATAQAETMTVFTYAQPTFAVKHNNVYWDDATLALTALMVVENAGQMASMATVAAPVQLSRSFPISLFGPAGQSWTAAVQTDGILDPQLNRSSGGSGDDLAIDVDTAGLLPGSYWADITINASTPIPGSPVTIPVQIYVVDRIYSTFSPLTIRP